MAVNRALWFRKRWKLNTGQPRWTAKLPPPDKNGSIDTIRIDFSLFDVSSWVSRCLSPSAEKTLKRLWVIWQCPSVTWLGAIFPVHAAFSHSDFFFKSRFSPKIQKGFVIAFLTSYVQVLIYYSAVLRLFLNSLALLIFAPIFISKVLGFFSLLGQLELRRRGHRFSSYFFLLFFF